MRTIRTSWPLELSTTSISSRAHRTSPPSKPSARTSICQWAPGSPASTSHSTAKTWTQPTYTGWTARACVGVHVCDGYFGRIGTVPWWYEAGIFSGGDPAVAIGPRPVNGHFSWANGSRVYYAMLADNFKGLSTFNGVKAIGVSRLDNPTASSVRQKSSWKPPTLLASQHRNTFRDKEQIWVDNAASSRYFGRAYMCFNEFDNANPDFAHIPLLVATSKDGGDHWNTNVVVGAKDSSLRFGCTIRTDSHGVMYLFTPRYIKDFDSLEGEHVVLKSFDGGKNWTKPRPLFSVTDVCQLFDPISGSCEMDGYAGARTDTSDAPAVDIANGAPTGADATNLIVDAWSDASAGLNNEQARISWSSDRGRSWHNPISVSLPGDRPLYVAPAISPAGDRAYVVYSAVTSPWRGSDMGSPRPYHGVLLGAPVGDDDDKYGDGPGPWTTVYNGPFGDLRASYPGHRLYEERVGDYVYAAASRDYGVGLWVDARDAAVCPAIQDRRARVLSVPGAAVIPAPWPLADCPRTFGNTDVWTATTG